MFFEKCKSVKKIKGIKLPSTTINMQLLAFESKIIYTEKY